MENEHETPEEQIASTTLNEVVDESTVAGDGAEEIDIEDPKTTELSVEYVDRWSSLISTTNWEKGQIIFDWRQTLMGSESAASSYSDEAWSRRVGGVTPQHVGRLRRVYERFSDSYKSYEGLYWSHFWAALDWDDAEMYLEGASRSGMSVSQMRKKRWEVTGADPASNPEEERLEVVAEDEDYTPLSEVGDDSSFQDDTRAVAEGPRPDGPDFGDEDNGSEGISVGEEEDVLPWEEEGDSADPVSPFANMPSLPNDLSDAVEQMKLAIIRHRADAWSEVGQADVVQAMDALRTFASQ